MPPKRGDDYRFSRYGDNSRPSVFYSCCSDMSTPISKNVPNTHENISNNCKSVIKEFKECIETKCIDIEELTRKTSKCLSDP